MTGSEHPPGGTAPPPWKLTDLAPAEQCEDKGDLAAVLSRLRNVKRVGPRQWSCRCPAHDDRRPSLSVGVGAFGRLLLHCHAGCATSQVIAKIGLRIRDLFPDPGNRGKRGLGRHPFFVRKKPPEHPAFRAEMADRVWRYALERARDDDAVEADRSVYRYLRDRGLAAGSDLSTFGVLHPTQQSVLPEAVRWWPSAGYRIVSPLFHHSGTLALVQARSILPDAARKTVFPRGGRAKGGLFASVAGRELLADADEGRQHRVVIFAEGLTDYLALAIASRVAVLATPGASMATACVASWARDRAVLVALDGDRQGEAAAIKVADAVHCEGGRPFRVDWPDDANDACDVVDRYGITGLGAFLDEVLGFVERRVFA